VNSRDGESVGREELYWWLSVLVAKFPVGEVTVTNAKALWLLWSLHN